MRRLSEDMARWEVGDLLLAEVEAAHPDDDVHILAELHAQLSVVSEEDPLVEAAGVWMEIRGRLHSPPPPRARFGRRMGRPLVAAAAAVLLVGGIAYAAGVAPIRETVTRVVRVVKGVFDDPGTELQAPGDSGPTRNRRDERSGPGGGGSLEDPGEEDRSGPGGGGDDRDDTEEDRSGPGGEGDGEDPDEDRSGPGGGDDDDDEPDDAEHEGPDDEDSSDGSGSSGSGSEDEPDEKDDFEDSNDVDD